MIKSQTSYYFNVSDGDCGTTVSLEVNEESSGKGLMTIKYNQDRRRTRKEHIAILSGIVKKLNEEKEGSEPVMGLQKQIVGL